MRRSGNSRPRGGPPLARRPAGCERRNPARNLSGRSAAIGRGRVERQAAGRIGHSAVRHPAILGWTWPRRPDLFELGNFPVWSIARPDGSSHYGFPMMPDNPGFKTAHHQAGRPPIRTACRARFCLATRKIFAIPWSVSSRRPGPHAGAADLSLHEHAGRAVHRRPASRASAGNLGLRLQRTRFQVHDRDGGSLESAGVGEKSTLPIEFLSLARFGS